VAQLENLLLVLARSLVDERPIPGYFADQLLATLDVSDEILAAVDRLLATGLAYGVWPRIEADPERGPDAGVLIVRADAAPPVLANGAVAFESDRGGRALGLGIAAARADRSSRSATSCRMAVW